MTQNLYQMTRRLHRKSPQQLRALLNKLAVIGATTKTNVSGYMRDVSHMMAWKQVEGPHKR